MPSTPETSLSPENLLEMEIPHLQPTDQKLQGRAHSVISKHLQA